MKGLRTPAGGLRTPAGRGLFISFEGVEGSGKSTQARLLKDYLEIRGYNVALTKEPGGTKISDRIRELLLANEHTEMDPVTELFLYFASRRQHIKELIEPSLKKGMIVITDRFSDSTAAYQGYGRGIDMGLIESLNSTAAEGLKPDLTILLDTDVEEGLRRNQGIKSDRLELENVEFHKKVREGFLEIAKKEPKRVKLIDSTGGIEKTHEAVVRAVEEFLGEKR